MNLLNNLTIRNLKLNKKRTIVTIIGIMLSVALITAVTSLFFSARDSLINFEIQQEGNYHYVFFDVPKEDLKYFNENRSIENNYLIQNIGYATLKESQNEYKPYAYIKAFTKESLNNLGLTLQEGRYPKNENEIVIPTHLKTNGRVKYQVGDTITLEVGTRISDGYELTQNEPYNTENNEEIINTKTKEYKIVGIISRPSSIIENYSAPGYTFITYLDENNINGTVDIYSRYTKKALKKDYIVTADIIGVDRELFKKAIGREGIFFENENELTDLEQKIAEEMENAKYQVDSNLYLITLESNIIENTSIQSLGLIVVIVCVIIIVTSVFCIKNSFDISIIEKTKQYGMLSSIGATKKQIKKNVYFEALIIGLIGIPLGIIFGLLAAFILIIVSNIFLSNMINIGLVFSFSYLAILFAIILGSITIYLSAWHSAHYASKISPIAAIRNSKDIKINSKKIKSPKLVNKIFGIGGQISYKNLKRNRKKYRTTVISIVICVSVFIALYSFITLAFDVVKKEYATTDYNILLSYQKTNDETTKKIHEIINFDNISKYSVISHLNAIIPNPNYSKEYLKVNKYANETYEYEDESGNIIESIPEEYISIYKVGDKSYKNYLQKLGLNYEEAKEKIILINHVNYWVNGENGKPGKNITVPVLNVKQKDNLSVILSNATLQLEIITLTQEDPFGISNDYTIHAIVSDEYFEELFNHYKEEKEFEKYETIAIYSTNPNKLQDEIDEYLKDYDYSLENIDENVKVMNSFYTLIAIFLYGFIIVIALIGVTNIFNTITTNMELRKQEFAMLKSIGMTNKEFNHMIRLESFFYGTKSLLIGIPIGCLLSYWLQKLLTEGMSISYRFPIAAIIICILSVFILISCIMKYSIKKINKQNTIETIRNENI